MKNSKRTTWAVLAAGIVAAGSFAAWKIYGPHRAWVTMRSNLPAVAGLVPPGLEPRLAASYARLQSWKPDRDALAEFALLCHANGFLSEAAAAYRGLVQLDPNQGRWPHLLATILAGYGELNEALPLLRRATELAPDHIASRLKLGDVLLKTNDVPAAEVAYQAVLSREPENPYALLGLARCDLQQERWTSARTRLQKAVSGAPNFSAAQHLLATVQERLGNPAAATVALARATQGAKRFGEAPDAWITELVPYCHDVYRLLVTAAATAAAGSPKQAMPALDRALALAPDDVRVLRQYGNTEAMLDHFKPARAHLEHAIALSPTDDYLYLDLIAVLRSTNDTAAISSVMGAGLAACPTSAGLHFEAGMAAVANQQWEAAVPHFESSWRSRPDESAAPIELAKVHLRLGHAEAGIAVLEQIVAAQPKELAAHLMLVRYGISSGDTRTSAWLERAAAAGGPTATLTELRQAYHRRFGSTP